MAPATPPLSFDRLVAAIGQANAELSAQASRAVNSSLTLRNWLIGLNIEEYERHGIDRQDYGDKLLDRLSESLKQRGVSRCDRRELYRYRQFYLAYPQIVETLSPQLAKALLPERQAQIRESLTPELARALRPGLGAEIRETASPELGGQVRPGGTESHANIVETPTPQLGVDAAEILTKLSFSHIAELLQCDDPTKRAFYELECIRGNWSVRELRRQIASLYYERSGLSKDKATLAALAQQGVERAEIALNIRDP